MWQDLLQPVQPEERLVEGTTTVHTSGLKLQIENVAHCSMNLRICYEENDAFTVNKETAHALSCFFMRVHKQLEVG